MSTGKVKFFNQQKGFGFIVDDETQKEVFVHVTGLIDKIKDDDLVSFEVVEDRRGPKAIKRQAAQTSILKFYLSFREQARNPTRRAGTVLMQLREIMPDEAPQQAHQFADFAGRPRPVFGAEGEDGENVDADIAAARTVRRSASTPRR